jgi:hypothetical protein
MKNNSLKRDCNPYQVSIIFLSITLIFLILPAFYSRFLADDYCLSAISKSTPFWPYLSSIFNTWTGKFSYISVLWFLGNLPPSSLFIILSVVCVTWIVLLSGFFHQVMMIFIDRKESLLSLLLAIILLLSLFYSTPNIFQNLYWLNGLVAYTLPIVLFNSTIYVALLVIKRKPFRYGYLIPLAILSFISCGFSEGPLIGVVVFYGSLILFSLATNRFKPGIAVFVTLVLLFLAGLTAFIVQYSAPGTLTRSSILSTRISFSNLILLTFRNVAHLYGKLLVYSPHWVIFAFFGSILIGLYLFKNGVKQKPSDRQVCLAWLMGFVVNTLIGLGICGAVVYFMQAYPDDRIIFIPYFFAYFAIIAIGTFTGLWIGSKQQMSQPRFKAFMKMAPILFTLVSIVIAFSTITNFMRSQPALLSYAQRWDARDAFIRAELAAGKRDLVIPGLESRYGLADLQLEKEDWVNNCTAGYYGANSITGK